MAGVTASPEKLKVTDAKEASRLIMTNLIAAGHGPARGYGCGCGLSFPFRCGGSYFFPFRCGGSCFCYAADCGCGFCCPLVQLPFSADPCANTVQENHPGPAAPQEPSAQLPSVLLLAKQAVIQWHR
mmetsp:Transcript_18851/g.30081  ORF Transcript_18851/g.30081 Transcript_18851/m.30081 type:complete len:127 (-) Transcript_18851:333-713(-)